MIVGSGPRRTPGRPEWPGTYEGTPAGGPDSAVFVVTPHALHGPLEARFVTSLGDEVEELVGGEEVLVGPGIAGVGVEDRTVLVLREALRPCSSSPSGG